MSVQIPCSRGESLSSPEWQFCHLYDGAGIPASEGVRIVETLPIVEKKQSARTQERAPERELSGILGSSPVVEDYVPAREAPCSSPCFGDTETVYSRTGSTCEHRGTKLKIIAARHVFPLPHPVCDWWVWEAVRQTGAMP